MSVLAKDVEPLLRGVVEVRRWMLDSIPQTRSAVGLDTFLRVAQELVEHPVVEAAAVARQLPYGHGAVRAQLRRMAHAGLLARDSEAGADAFAATPKLHALIEAYQRKLEGPFIVREPLRASQLLLATRERALAALVQQLYDRFFDLGWLHLHTYGSVCFLMASLVARVVRLHGREARVDSGFAEVVKPGCSYRLGAPGLARPGQIDGHAICIVDESVVVDFGLGNVRKGYRTDFYWGVAADLDRKGPVLAVAETGGNELLCWRDDWRYPATEAELAKYPALLDQLLARYRERFDDAPLAA